MNRFEPPYFCFLRKSWKAFAEPDNGARIRVLLANGFQPSADHWNHVVCAKYVSGMDVVPDWQKID